MGKKNKYQRILLKLSGEFLGNEKGTGIDIKSLLNLIDEIIPLIKLKIQIGIVLGGGNIFRGALKRQKEKFKLPFTQTEADKAGMFATIINSLLLSDLLTQKKIKNKLLSTIFVDTIEFYNPQKAKGYLEQGYLNIYAGGTSNPYFTTDTAATLKAIETQCDILIKATKVDGVYDKDPIKYQDASFFNKITYLDVIGKQLKIMDLTALSLAMENELPISVINFCKQGNLLKFIRTNKIGTKIVSHL